MSDTIFFSSKKKKKKKNIDLFMNQMFIYLCIKCSIGTQG